MAADKVKGIVIGGAVSDRVPGAVQGVQEHVHITGAGAAGLEDKLEGNDLVARAEEANGAPSQTALSETRSPVPARSSRLTSLRHPLPKTGRDAAFRQLQGYPWLTAAYEGVEESSQA